MHFRGSYASAVNLLAVLAGMQQNPGPQPLSFSNSQARCMFDLSVSCQIAASSELEIGGRSGIQTILPARSGLSLLSPFTFVFSSWLSATLTSGPKKAGAFHKHWNQIPRSHEVRSLQSMPYFASVVGIPLLELNPDWYRDPRSTPFLILLVIQLRGANRSTSHEFVWPCYYQDHVSAYHLYEYH